MEVEGNIKQRVLRHTLEEARGRSPSEKISTDPCVICLEPISERAFTAPCNHYSFDFLCLVSWLQERSKCPLCMFKYPLNLTYADKEPGNSPVQSVEYDWRSPEDYKSYKVPPSTSSQSESPSTSSSSYPSHPRRPGCPPRPYRRPGYQPPRRQPPLGANNILLRRRDVYRRQLYSLYVGSNRISRFRDLNPKAFNKDQELISRARKWIRRELQVFDFLNSDSGEDHTVTRKANNAEFLLEYIIAMLKTVNVKGSGGQAEDMLQEFLGRDNSRLFLHELGAWLRSPYSSLEDWDRHVQYDETLQVESSTVKSLATVVDGEQSRQRTRSGSDRYGPYTGCPRRDRKPLGPGRHGNG